MSAAADHPYSLTYESNGVVYVSGATGIDVDGRPILDRRPALDAALAEVRSRLESVGLGLENLVKTNYFVTDVSWRDAANEQYAEVFLEPRPARSFVAIAALPYGAQAMIEGVAHR